MANQLPPMKCGHCGALVKAKSGARSAVCTHCGATLAVPDSFAGLLPGQAVGAVIAPPPPEGARRRARSRRRALAVLGLLIVGGIAAAVAGFLKLKHDREAATANQVHWLTSGRSPVPAVVRESGSGGLLLGYVRRGPETQPATLAAFDLQTLALRWESAPVDHGGVGDAAGSDVVTAHKGHAAAATGSNRIELLELGTGKSVASVELPDRVLGVTAPPDSTPYVSARLANGSVVKVSVPDGATRPDTGHEHPASGPPPAEGTCWPSLGVYSCVEAGKLPKLERHQARYAMQIGTTLFVIAQPLEAGNPDPTRDSVLAIEEGADKPRWTENLEGKIVTELMSSDLLYLVLRAPSGLRLRALKLDTGFKAFDDALPNPDQATAKRPLLDHDRLYLPRADWLDVIDAKSGAAIGALGAR